MNKHTELMNPQSTTTGGKRRRSGGGRPPFSTDRRKQQLCIRVLPETLTRIDRMAALAGVTRAEMARRVLLQSLDAVTGRV